MKIVVIGGSGLIGSRLVTALRQRGQEVLAASPGTGVDTLAGAGLEVALTRAQVVIDVINAPSFEETAASSFFEISTRNLLAAEAASGVRHHVVLSVVGTDQMQGSGYFRGKLAQERMSAASGIPFTIVRCTQFFEFMRRLADIYGDKKTVRMPRAMVQPIAADDAVAALADIALSPPANGTVEVAGPEVFRFDDIVGQVLATTKDPRNVLADIYTRYFGAQVHEQTLVPGGAARLGSTRFATWLGLQKAA